MARTGVTVFHAKGTMLLGPVVVDREGISPCGHTFSFGRRGVGEITKTPCNALYLFISHPPLHPNIHSSFAYVVALVHNTL